MATAYEDYRARTIFELVLEPGDEFYTFHYGHNPIDLMCGLTRHLTGLPPEVIGSAVPLVPIEIGKSALLGVDMFSKDQHVLQTPIVSHLGPAADEFQPWF